MSVDSRSTEEIVNNICDQVVELINRKVPTVFGVLRANELNHPYLNLLTMGNYQHSCVFIAALIQRVLLGCVDEDFLAEHGRQNVRDMIFANVEKILKEEGKNLEYMFNGQFKKDDAEGPPTDKNGVPYYDVPEKASSKKDDSKILSLKNRKKPDDPD